MIFGTDGVRGRAGVEITPMFVMQLGIAAGLYFSKSALSHKILVGKDTRKSGYMIENALVSALTSVGYDVIQIGPMPTPAIAFLSENMRCDAGVMISASHNPFEDNGIKFFDRFGYKLQRESELEIEKIFANENLIRNSCQVGVGIGSSKRIDDVIGRYIVHLKNSFPKHLSLQGMRVVIDTANGAGYKVAPIVFSELGADVIVINDKPNGSNINAQCGALFPLELSQEVKRYRADLGIALDGDADRLVVVDNLGQVVHGDKLIGVLASYQHQNQQLAQAKVVVTSMSNLALQEYLNAQGISVVICDVGDKFVSAAMIAHKANFGAEQSGHIILGDYSKSGDGIMSALQVSALLVQANKPSCEVLNPFKLCPQVLENLPIKHKKPLEKIPGFKEVIKTLEQHHIRHLIRYSGTENLLRILLEGKDSALLKSKTQELKTFFHEKLG
ncbi:phosphoglucosamine mutase [Helicobacter bizzozeronii]|uniref:phosphoglucosamine mutase n=1 Tax=Helicobacter bizzozeronii TaxID=56877 RepID=UPI00024E5AEC|nr:phosphoglucosamine mutase [Helicobacter bizzozeronii]CCF79811.1 Phosphoglucosamine mutase [Helicobacter bizzozeronii CCUG 35545]